jgi:hypothetical protein
MRLTFMILIFSFVLAACSAGTGTTESPSEVPATPMPSTSEEPMPTESESADPAPTDMPSDEPTDAPRALTDIDSVVATIVEGLSLRRGEGTDAERIGLLSLGTVAYVVSGPTEVDGVPWYEIAGMGLPYASGCATAPPDAPISCQSFHGWVAGESADGDPWIAATEPDACPEPTLVNVSETGSVRRLVCWGDDEITFDAFWPELPEDAGLGGMCPPIDELGGFLYCQNINYNALAASPEEGIAGVARLNLSIDPASAVEMPERGQWVRVSGGFDHPAAAGCADIAAGEGHPDPAWAALHCRTEFVPTAIVPLGQ